MQNKVLFATTILQGLALSCVGGDEQIDNLEIPQDDDYVEEQKDELDEPDDSGDSDEPTVKVSGKGMNVLFMVVDDLSDALGCYGHSIVKTPNIDKLAQSGVQFNKAYCNFPVSGPSRASFLTGLRPESIGVLANTTMLSTVIGDRVSLPYLYKLNGYRTVNLNKIFHQPNNQAYGDEKAWSDYYEFSTTSLGSSGTSRNMTADIAAANDDVDELSWCKWLMANGGDEDQVDGQVAAKAIDVILEDSDEPFFLGVGWAKPHDPYWAPAEYFDLYPLSECEPHQVPDGYEAPNVRTFPAYTETTFTKFTDNDKREYLRSYYACISFMDAQVGKVMDALEESGKADNTIIIFFSDHGYHLGEHNHWGKFTVLERGSRVPFIMAGATIPESSRGTVCDSYIELLDIYPTLAELSELEESVPADLEGVSYTQLLDDPEAQTKTNSQTIILRNKIGRSIVNDQWRYVEWDDNGVAEYRELYNVQDDYFEYVNLSADDNYSSIISQMSSLLTRPY
ncbi:MAG: sulfatase [Rikenellaceae bacterium]